MIMIPVCCYTGNKAGWDLVQWNSLHSNLAQSAVLLELLVEQQQRGVEGEHGSRGSNYLNIKTDSGLGTNCVWRAGETKEALEKYLEWSIISKRYYSRNWLHPHGFRISYSCHRAMLQIFIIKWKQSKRYFLGMPNTNINWKMYLFSLE